MIPQCIITDKIPIFELLTNSQNLPIVTHIRTNFRGENCKKCVIFFTTIMRNNKYLSILHILDSLHLSHEEILQQTQYLRFRSFFASL